VPITVIVRGFNTADLISRITESPIVAENNKVCLAHIVALSTICDNKES